MMKLSMRSDACCYTLPSVVTASTDMKPLSSPLANEILEPRELKNQDLTHALSNDDGDKMSTKEEEVDEPCQPVSYNPSESDDIAIPDDDDEVLIES